jgi:DNA-binding response OmpR family regulator
MPRILVVEDDAAVQRAIGRILGGDGHSIRYAQTGAEALALAKPNAFDLIILDIGLPGASGLEVAQELMATCDIPIIFLTGRASEQDILMGLALGADEYITKPFSPPVFSARVRTVLRRVRRQLEEPDSAEVRRIGALTVDGGQWRVELAGRELALRGREFRLLHYLLTNPHQVHSRDRLIERVWGDEFDGTDRVVDVCLSRLRRQLFDLDDCPVTVKAIPSVGYKLIDKATQAQ